MAASMSASLGCGFSARSAEACMICPTWQYPHCATLPAIQARWTGWLLSGLNPSMLTTVRPATAQASVPKAARP